MTKIFFLLLLIFLPEFAGQRRKQTASLEIPRRLDREKAFFGKHFQSAGQDYYLLCAYPKFTSKINGLVISLHDSD